VPLVLTEQSTVVCADQAAVQKTAGQSKLTVAGAPVLVDGDLNGASVSACPTVTDPMTGQIKCAAVASVIGGVATKLKVGGKGVLLETVAGQTNGALPGGAPKTWSVQSAGQTRLTTV
jgi:hypothetical protein